MEQGTVIPGSAWRGRRASLFARLWLAGMAGLAVLSGGCNATGPQEWIQNGFKVGPNYSEPPAPVAEKWIDTDTAHVQNRYLQEWWRVFEDSTLDRLIDTAYANNPNLRVLAARVLEARAQRAIAMGSLFPQMQQATGQYSRIDLSRNTFNNPAVLQALFPGPLPPGTMFGNFYSDWTAGFNLSWELDFWGRLRRNLESADARVDASVDSLDDGLVTLLADVATAYVQYRVAQQRIRIARDNVLIQDATRALVEKQVRVGVGKVTVVDLDQAKTVLEATRATIPALQIVQGQANDQLCILLGIPPRNLEPELGPGPEPGKKPMPDKLDWVAAGIPADLLRRRPDIRAAERQVAAQNAQIGVAMADFYPVIAINGTLGYEAADLSQLFESRSFFGNITPAFRWNILNYGRIQNNVRLQQARTQELVAAYQSQVLAAAREAQTALRGFHQSQEQAERLAAAVRAATAGTKLGVRQYGTGTIIFNVVFQLETAQVQQQDQLAVAQGTVALNLISAYRALGGGWEIRCRTGQQQQPGEAGTDVAKDVERRTAPAAGPPEKIPPPPN
jgi:NodT family efflux transporter outer membrane factor (OMF) lipoprotein